MVAEGVRAGAGNNRCADFAMFCYAELWLKLVRCDAGISVTAGQQGSSGSWELAPHLNHRVCGSGKPSGACGSRLSAEKAAGEGQLGGV